MAERVLMAPSILSADFTRLAEAVELVEGAGADYLHVDVMDGHFVPNLTIGPPVVKALKAVTSLPLDVHLMIDNVDDTVGGYLDAGADLVVVHAEACYHLHRVVGAIRGAGARAGVVLNPATPVSVLEDILPELDLVLLMSVNPGFGGQSFIRTTPDKLHRLRELCYQIGSCADIEVDGGINAETAPLVTAAGARLLVAGNAVFGAPDPVSAVRGIREAGEGALE
jgi:ribulose-phosphate 3-epimerase